MKLRLDENLSRRIVPSLQQALRGAMNRFVAQDFLG